MSSVITKSFLQQFYLLGERVWKSPPLEDSDLSMYKRLTFDAFPPLDALPFLPQVVHEDDNAVALASLLGLFNTAGLILFVISVFSRSWLQPSLVRALWLSGKWCKA